MDPAFMRMFDRNLVNGDKLVDSASVGGVAISSDGNPIPLPHVDKNDMHYAQLVSENIK